MSMTNILQAVDDAFQVWGRSAPPVRADENPNTDYVRRIARIAQKKGYLSYDEPIKNVRFAELPDHSLPQFTQLPLEGIKRSVLRSDTVPDGTERQVFTRDDNTGLAIRGFVRPSGDSFVRDPEVGARACRRVDCIKSPGGNVYYRSARTARALDALARGY
jgi:hypothetical protein